MLKKNTIFDFMINVMVVFSISIISLCLFTFLFGKDAQEVSTIFALGEKGIPLPTMMQFLVMSFMITMLRWIYFTDRLIKNLSLTFRIILMFLTVILMIAILAAVFEWFPVNMVLPWVVFLLCFVIYATGSVILFYLKEKKENEKLQEALEVLKKENV